MLNHILVKICLDYAGGQIYSFTYNTVMDNSIKASSLLGSQRVLYQIYPTSTC